jgi:hypothetical protein
VTRVGIVQSNYVPWKGYFDLIHDVDVFVYYDEVQYTKNDWRNRNRIYSKNGLQWLTIPIDKDAVKSAISAVVLEDSRWQTTHFRSLYYAYKPAPFFGQLLPLLEDTYHGPRWHSLSALNRHLIERIARLLGVTTRFVDSKDFELVPDRIERLIHLLRQLGADTYVSGPSARHYLAGHERRFAEQGIALMYKDYAGYPSYRQLRTPFEGAVSVLDMLANIEVSEIGQYIWGWRESGAAGDRAGA